MSGEELKEGRTEERIDDEQREDRDSEGRWEAYVGLRKEQTTRKRKGKRKGLKQGIGKKIWD